MGNKKAPVFTRADSLVILVKNYFFSKSRISDNKSLSDGPAGAAASTGFFVLLYALISINITNPTIIKLMIVLIHLP